MDAAREREVGVGGNEIQIEFERIRAGLLDLVRVLDPAAARNAVEAGDHGKIDRRFGSTQMLEIQIRGQLVVVEIREVAQSLGGAVAAVRQAVIRRQAFVSDLLLKERVEHDRRRACVLHSADRIEPLGER